MTKSRSIVTMPIAAALNYRFMFHSSFMMLASVVPMLIYQWWFYRDVNELRKFDLPTGCIISAIESQPWWMIPPFGVLWGGILIYGILVYIFSDRKNDSGIVNLVSKNSTSGELIEVKI